MLRQFTRPTTTPVTLGVGLTLGEVTVTAEDVTNVTVVLRPAVDGDTVAEGLINRADISFDGVELFVHVPPPPANHGGVYGRGVQIGMVMGDVNIDQSVRVSGGSTVHQSGRDLVVHNINSAGDNTPGAVIAEIVVPTDSTLDANLKQADLTTRGRLTAVTGKSSQGSVTVETVRHHVTYRTSQGGIRVTSAPDVDVNASQGNIHIGNADRVLARTNQGGITVLQANDAQLNASQGNIAVTHRAHRLRAVAGQGSITLTVTGSDAEGDGTAYLRASMGNVTVKGSSRRRNYVVDAAATMGKVKIG